MSSFVLQNSVTGPEKKLEKAIDLAYTTLMHVQLCSHAHLIMWLAHCMLCKQHQLAYMYSVAVLIIPMQLARSYSCMTSPRHQHLWCYFLTSCQIQCFVTIIITDVMIGVSEAHTTGSFDRNTERLLRGHSIACDSSTSIVLYHS